MRTRARLGEESKRNSARASFLAIMHMRLVPSRAARVGSNSQQRIQFSELFGKKAHALELAARGMRARLCARARCYISNAFAFGQARAFIPNFLRETTAPNVHAARALKNRARGFQAITASRAHRTKVPPETTFTA